MNDYVNPKTPGVVFYSIVAVSMSMIAFEISLVRLLSVVLSYHYVYGITSLALLGSGIGACIHYREKKSGADYMSMLYRRLNFRLIMAAVTMIFVTIAIIQAAKGGGSIVFMEFYSVCLFLSGNVSFVIIPSVFGNWKQVVFHGSVGSSFRLYIGSNST